MTCRNSAQNTKDMRNLLILTLCKPTRFAWNCAGQDPQRGATRASLLMMEPPPSLRDLTPLRKKAKLNPPPRPNSGKQGEDAGLPNKSVQIPGRSASDTNPQNRPRSHSAVARHAGFPPDRVTALATPNELQNSRYGQCWTSGGKIPAK